MLLTLLFHNYLAFAPLVAYLVAQILKTILYSVMNKRFEYKRILGSGGMPSSHTATVVALATAAIKQLGLLSPVTAICFVVAAIVIYDARGVRQEVGKHAKVLTDLLMKLRGMNTDVIDIQFSEMVGHTFLQVFVGAMIGIAIPLCIPQF